MCMYVPEMLPLFGSCASTVTERELQREKEGPPASYLPWLQSQGLIFPLLARPLMNLNRKKI